MNVREFPVLDEDDRAVVEAFAVGLGDDEARVLAYLHRRRAVAAVDEPASLLAVRVGTDRNRNAAERALSALADAGLVEATTLPSEGRGRPPRGWRAEADRDALRDRVYAHRASTLLDRAGDLGDALLGDGTPGPDDAGTAAGDSETIADDAGSAADDACMVADDAWGVADDAGSAAGDSDTSDSADAAAPTVSLNWRPNGLQLPFFAAQEAGAYADAGHEVDLVHRRGSDEALADVAAGDATVGVVGAATLRRAVERGTPVVPLAVCYQRAPAVLYTTREAFGEPFERAGQLRDRRVGMPVDSELGLLGRMFLAQADDAADATVVDVAGEEWRALREGRVDAVTGSFADPERRRAAGLTVDVVPIADQFPIYGPALVARRAALAERRAALRAVLVGTMTGLARAARDPSGAAETVAAASDHSPAQVRRIYETAAETFGTSEAVAAAGWGAHCHDEWDRLAAVLRGVGLMPA